MISFLNKSLCALKSKVRAPLLQILSDFYEKPDFWSKGKTILEINLWGLFLDILALFFYVIKLFNELSYCQSFRDFIILQWNFFVGCLRGMLQSASIFVICTDFYDSHYKCI